MDFRITVANNYRKIDGKVENFPRNLDGNSVIWLEILELKDTITEMTN